MLGRVLRRAEVHLYSDGLSADTTRGALLQPVDDLSAAVTELLGRSAGRRLAVLPEGPLTVASLGV